MHVPKGSMCVNCINAKDDCSSLEFNRMRVIGRFSEEGANFLEVACTERHTKGIDELEAEVKELRQLIKYYESEEYKDDIQDERLVKYLQELGSQRG